jgi:hypothetical protein
MKWAREFIFGDFALEEEEEKDNDDFEMAMTVISKDEIRQPRLGSVVCTSTEIILLSIITLPGCASASSEPCRVFGVE